MRECAAAGKSDLTKLLWHGHTKCNCNGPLATDGYSPIDLWLALNA